MLIAVIIPTRNRADLLAAALRSLKAQTLGPDRFEVVVADNASTDGTRAVVEEARAFLPNLRYVHEPQPGLHHARHRGMNACSAEVLVFADDDIEALPTWLESVESAFRDPEVAMAGGNNLPLFLESPPSWLLALWDVNRIEGGHAFPPLSLLQLERGVGEISPFYIWGCNFAIRRQDLLAAGGFHPDGMPREQLAFRGDGETHVARQVLLSGRKSIFHPGASIYHKVTPERATVGYFWQRGYTEGISHSYARLRNPEQAALFGQRPGRGRALASRLARVFRHMRLLQPTALRALIALRLGFRAGFRFHQQQYRRSEEVRAWVHRPDYLPS
jgi:glycosyltransferase involved in cell wall biosynthesis